MDLDTNQWTEKKKKFSNINSILFYSFKHLHYSAFTTYFGIKIFVSNDLRNLLLMSVTQSLDTLYMTVYNL